MKRVPRGIGLAMGLYGIIAAAFLSARDSGISGVTAVVVFAVLSIVPVIAGIIWNKYGKHFLLKLSRGDDELAGKLADTVEIVFFIGVVVTLVVLYNMDLFI